MPVHGVRQNFTNSLICPTLFIYQCAPFFLKFTLEMNEMKWYVCKGRIAYCFHTQEKQRFGIPKVIYTELFACAIPASHKLHLLTRSTSLRLIWNCMLQNVIAVHASVA